MVKHFFITGLPRSRTAWLSNLMTTGSIICLHEATLNEFVDVVASGNYTHVGMSNTNLYEMGDVVGDSPLLIVERDIDEVHKWTQDYCSRSFLTYIEYRLALLGGMRIPFNEIDSNLLQIWKHLIGTPFDTVRAAYLQDFNIQVTDKRIEELKL